MANQIGTPERPLRAAVIGAGPSGFYVAAAILKETDPCSRASPNSAASRAR